MTDEPILPDDGASPHSAVVIDLAGIRVQWGRPKYRPGGPCPHKSLSYSQSERRVWCRDCERTIDSFDAFMVFVSNYQAMLREVNSKARIAEETLKSRINRRGAKEIDKVWSGRKMAILCPHCHGGLLPEDFVNGRATTSRDIELARRKRAKEQE